MRWLLRQLVLVHKEGGLARTTDSSWRGDTICPCAYYHHEQQVGVAQHAFDHLVTCAPSSDTQCIPPACSFTDTCCTLYSLPASAACSANHVIAMCYKHNCSNRLLDASWKRKNTRKKAVELTCFQCLQRTASSYGESRMRKAARKQA